MKSFPIIVRLGGRSRHIKTSARVLTRARGKLYGLTEYYGPEHGKASRCEVWIYSRQSPRELADTFFHEMMHVFLHMIGGKTTQGRREEQMASWNGYLSKMLLADYDTRYARKSK